MPVYAGQMDYSDQRSHPTVAVPQKEVKQIWFDASSNVVVWEIHLFKEDQGYILPGYYLDQYDCEDSIEYVHFLYKALAESGEMRCLDEVYPSHLLTFE